MNQDILKKIGIKVGHYTDERNLTGLTCFIAEAGAHIGIDIRGSHAGTFNTPAYDPKSTLELAYSVVLSGGSLYGLESTFGIMQYLEENSIGRRFREGIIPELTGAVIYDLAVGDSNVRPKRKMDTMQHNKLQILALLKEALVLEREQLWENGRRVSQ